MEKKYFRIYGSGERNILEILKREPIRFIDGRYSDGFVKGADLNKLIELGWAEIYDNNGTEFVRRKELK
jgi:hypothetical protein